MTDSSAIEALEGEPVSSWIATAGTTSYPALDGKGARHIGHLATVEDVPDLAGSARPASSTTISRHFQLGCTKREPRDSSM